MWWASFSYLCLQGTSFGELEKTRAPSSVFKYKRNIQNCSTMEYHRWLVDDFFPFRCGPHATTTNKIHVKIERKTGYENVISLEFSYISFCGQFYPICDACIHTPTREREREQSSFIYIYCTVHTIVFISHLSLYLSTLCWCSLYPLLLLASLDWTTNPPLLSLFTFFCVCVLSSLSTD